MTLYTALLAEIKNEYPEFRLTSKSTSWFMKLCNFLLMGITFGQLKTFMGQMTTTIGYTIYTPSEWDLWSDAVKTSILRHERVHMKQRKDKGSFWFSLSYLLLPLPLFCAYFRMKYEMEAYEESMRARYETAGKKAFNPVYRIEMIERFTGASYFWTWLGRGRIEEWYDATVTKICS